MNMAAGMSSAQCPNCRRSIGRWIEPRMTHICVSCGGALVRLRVRRKLRLYRIIPVTKLLRILGSVVALAAIVSALAMPEGIRNAVFMVAVALATFGTADIVEVWFDVRGRWRSHGTMARKPNAKGWETFGQVTLGLLYILLAAIGFVVWASVTIEL